MPSCDLLEKSYFCSITNNSRNMGCPPSLLWFAWKIVLLQYRKQRTCEIALSAIRCDLLEKSYFCSIANNLEFRPKPICLVVICLKNRTFAVSQTTNSEISLFKTGCDLLEKSYFCSIANNLLAEIKDGVMLWFAWKIVLLQYRKQRMQDDTEVHKGCDLLEKSYFCSIANNNWPPTTTCYGVVICLKNRTFAVSQTTKAVISELRGGCDLLEKSYFCSIANN